MKLWLLVLMFFLCTFSPCKGALGQGEGTAVPAKPANTVPTVPPACQKLVHYIFVTSPTDSNAMNTAIADSLRPGQSSVCFAQLVAQSPTLKSAVQQAEGSSFSNFIKVLESQRTDKQAGSSTGTGGTTNLVSKGVVAQALSVAAEYGALTESTSNKIVTVQGSLDGLAAAAIRQSLFSYCPDSPKGGENQPGPTCIHQGELRFLSRISYGVSFNANLAAQQLSGTASGSQAGTAQPVTFSASSSDISSVTAKAVLWNNRNTTSNDFKTAWADALSPSSTSASKGTTTSCTGKGTSATSGGSSSNTPSLLDAAATSLATSLTTLMNSLNFQSSSEYKDWFQTASQALRDAKGRAATEAELEETWLDHENKFVTLAAKLDPNLAQHVASLLQATARYQFEEEQFVSCIADKPVLTAEYDYNQPTGQTPYSTVRAIFDKSFGKTAAWTVTANVAAAVYDERPSYTIPGARRLRDVQAGVEVDRKLGSLSFVGAPVVSATGYFQDQTSPAILNVTPSTPLTGITITGLPSNATQVFAKKGNIAIAQLKVTLGSGKSSVRVPFAVSYSNRTELITKPEWKAQIGISYDFDSLFASSGSGKTTQ